MSQMARDAGEQAVDWAAGARDKVADAAGSAARRIKKAAEPSRSSPRNTVEWAASLGDSAVAAYDPTTESRAASIMAAARDNRLSLCLIGAGLAWMLLSNSRTASQVGARASDRLSRGSEGVRDALAEAGQRMTETAKDASDRVRDWAGDARDKVSDVLHSATSQGASSPAESGSSSAAWEEAAVPTGAGANTERAYEQAGGQAQAKELTGLAGKQDMHTDEATLVPAAPSTTADCRADGPTIASLREHREGRENKEHEPTTP
jgi:vacuolar-type H+-ATPase subunit H